MTETRVASKIRPPISRIRAFARLQRPRREPLPRAGHAEARRERGERRRRGASPGCGRDRRRRAPGRRQCGRRGDRDGLRGRRRRAVDERHRRHRRDADPRGAERPRLGDRLRRPLARDPRSRRLCARGRHRQRSLRLARGGREPQSGPYAVAIPAMVAGHAMAHELFATKTWEELVLPAADIAEAGAQVDWHTTLWIAAAFGDLLRDPGCRAQFLPGGVPPVSPGAAIGAPPRLKWPALAKTLRTVARPGPR